MNENNPGKNERELSESDRAALRTLLNAQNGDLLGRAIGTEGPMSVPYWLVHGETASPEPEAEESTDE